MPTIRAKIMTAHANVSNLRNGVLHPQECPNLSSLDIHFQEVDAVEPLLVAHIVQSRRSHLRAVSSSTNRIGLPDFSIVYQNNAGDIHHRGVNRDDIAEPIKLAEALQMVVGYRMGFNGENFAGRAHFSRERENVFPAARPYIDDDIPRLRFVFAEPEVCCVPEIGSSSFHASTVGS